MKPKYFYLLALFLPLIFSGCKTIGLNSSRLAQPLEINGTLDNWPKAFPVFLADSSISIQAANDDMYLYLAISTDDPEYREDFRHTGLTMWVDLKGGKSKQVEIHFPASTHARFNARQGGFWQSLTEEEKTRASEELDQLAGGVLVYNQNIKQALNFPANDASGFAAATSRFDGEKIIEIRIPLQFQKDFLAMELPQGQKTVGIGIETGGRTRGGFQPPNSGERPGAMRRGGFGGRSSRSRFIAESKEFWLEVHLAK